MRGAKAGGAAMMPMANTQDQGLILSIIWYLLY
mgnify:CR=1 FL=1